MVKNSLKDFFCETARVRKENPCISFFRGDRVETEISYSELNRDSNKMAKIFLDFGVKKGDRVILHLRKSLVFVVAYWGLQKIGAVAVPLNPDFTKSEMSYLVSDAHARLIVAGTAQEAKIKGLKLNLEMLVIDTEIPYREQDFIKSSPEYVISVNIRTEDPGLIIYTSGTTGWPKGAILTQGNLIHDAKNIIKVLEMTESDVLCHALPLFHVHGLCFALHTVLMAGAHVLMLDVFSPEKVLDVMTKRDWKYRCNLFMAVPSMYSKILDYSEGRELDLGHVRLWASGSAPLLVKDFERIKSIFGREPVEREGMSETGVNFSNPIGGMKKPGSDTKPHEIRNHCRKKLHSWKCPKEIFLVKDLPKNSMGKVLKEDLKKRLLDTTPVII